MSLLNSSKLSLWRQFWSLGSKAAVVALVVVSCVIVFQAICVGAVQKTPVEVLQKGEDSIGVRFAYQIKEEIKKSSSYRLSSIDLPILRILITSDDSANLIAVEEIRKNNLNLKSVMALVHTMLTKDGEFYIAGYLVYVGGQTIKEQAEEMVARIGKF